MLLRNIFQGKNRSYLVLLSILTLQVSIEAMEMYELPGMVFPDGEEALIEQMKHRVRESVEEKPESTVSGTLHEAAARGDEMTLAALLAGGADVNSLDGHHCTALHYAAQMGHEACVSVLILHGRADVNVVDRFGDTALHLATLNGHESCLRVILQAVGVNVGAIGSFGDIALQRAIVKEQKACAQLLVSYYSANNINIPKKLKAGLRGLGINIKKSTCLVL